MWYVSRTTAITIDIFNVLLEDLNSYLIRNYYSNSEQNDEMAIEHLTAVTYARDKMTAKLRRPLNVESSKPDRRARVRQGWAPPLPQTYEYVLCSRPH